MSRCLKDRRSTGLSLLATLVVAILALAGPADAQVLYGSIVGNVTDTSQASVPGATVTAIHESTNLARETTTTGDGGYAFANLQEGNYTLRISLQGFKESVTEQVPVTPNTVSRVDITLEVGALTETVTVQSERTLLQTDAGDLHSVIDSEEITSLPLGNYRNYQALLNLIPGTTPAAFQNAITDTPARALTTQVNGTARNNNTTRVDGATNVFVFLPHHQIYVAPAETVQTVNVATASFDAEAGNAGGSHTTVMTKSGTNQFHGSGVYLFENDGLRARNFFNSGDKPESSRKIGAATLGGPIIKDKLFFFAGWEGHYLQGSTTRTGTLPTADQRRGDFSAYDSIIYDPLTGNSDGTGRTPFPGNIIPANRIHPTSAQIQSLIPMPNADGITGNYSDTGPFNLDRNNYDAKVNWNVTNSVMVWGKYSRMKAEVTSDMWLGNPQDGGIGGSGFGTGSGLGDTVVDLISGGFTYTLSPSLVMDGVISYSNFDQSVIPPDFGTSYGLDVFNIPGTNGASPITGGSDDIRYTGMPRWSIDGYENLGGVDGWSPIFRNDNTYNASINATWIKKNHEFRFGFDYVRLEQNHWQPELGHPRGRFNHDGGVTALNGGAASSQFNAYAEFLLGFATESQKSVQWETMQARENHYAFYVRDRWQVNRNLTLTLGLRWEGYPLMQRVGRGMETYDVTTNEVLLCGSDNCGINLEQPGILPRLGFAYRLGEDNVFRGGFGRTATPAPYARPLRGFYPLMISNSFVAETEFTPVTGFTQGIPLFDGPDLNQARVEAPATAEVRVPIGTLTRGYIDSWNLIYERRLPWDMSLSTGYVGTRSVDVLGYENLNASSIGQGQSGRPLFEPYGRTQNLWRWNGTPDLNMNYHSLQVALNKPFARGLFIKAAYTWSKAMGRQEDEGWVNLLWAEEGAKHKNYSWQGYDRTQVFQMGFVWEMPFGRDGEGALSAIIKDWSVNGTFAAMVGTPFRVTSSGSSVNAPGNGQSADRIGEPTVLGGIGGGSPYYDTSAWAPVSEVRYGNEGDNSIRGPGQVNLDLGLFRRFPVGDRVNLEFRIEAFNVTNTPHFRNPNGNANSGGFMTITSTGSSASANDGQERQIRIGAAIRF